MKYHHSILLAAFFFVFSCDSGENNNDDNSEPVAVGLLSKSDSLIQNAVSAHGGHLYDRAAYQFTFREKLYTFKNNGSRYKYTSEFQTDAGWQKDVFKDGEFSRTLAGKELKINEVDAGKYGETLNAVIYFATLPHKLTDVSVNSKFLGQKRIKNKLYNEVLVTFTQEGGGQDFQDEYFYWFNVENSRMDYFAYNYQVNGGGVRFRSAYNTREVEGILFQDYINYSAPVGTALGKLPELYQRDSLIELSRIELAGVKSIK